MRAAVVAAVLSVLILLFAGCEMTPEQRLAALQSYVNAGQAASQNLDDAIAAAELVIEETETAMADANMPPTEAAKVFAIQNEARRYIAKFKSQKTLIDQDVAKWERLLVKAQTEGVDAISEMEVYGGGIQILGTRIGGTAGGYITLAGALIAGLGGTLVGLVKSLRTRKTLEGVVGSVSALLASDAVLDPEQAKSVLQAVQLPPVRSEVRTILGKQ